MDIQSPLTTSVLIRLIIIYNHILQYTCGNVLHKTVGELAKHFHLATTNTNGGHTHTLSLRQRHGSHGGGGQASYGDGDVWGGTVVGTTNNSGNHTHTITVNNTGDGNAHNNMQPYYTCYMWCRTV